MAIVTIAHVTGSGGPEIGTAVAERLGYRYVDREMLSAAATKYGVQEERLTQLDETKPSLLERFDVETRQYITVIQSALFDVAEQDQVVINSRGGQILLRGVPHVLRVRVIAPFDLRVRRVMTKMTGQMSESVDFRTTAEMVRRSDQEKFGRMRYLYDVDWGDSSLYDLVLNTERLSVEAAVDVITGLARRAELQATPESRQMVRDRALASRVRSALAAHPETRKYRINVESEQGVIRLEGTAALEKATDVARGVTDVVDVKSQLLEVPPIPPFVA
jgi:cytidylate kinase